MARILFERAVYVQRKYFIDEITSLDEAFDFLEAWPEAKRDLPYDTLLKACREAVNGRFPIAAVRENLRRFLKKAGMLAEFDDVPNADQLVADRNIGNV
ncbi:DUF982 domain-containing protein (plasmid) [Rhizobium sp. T1470]|uniref:DUF982 domain-containing protein n=1 Tax=unclassified Rhizobium TaxID=2613769 RepID=UPI001AAFDCC9|nr:DUF982 domain-containing protein [Rhizobium sp. T1473]MCA0806054.1 DUF982 domain-containing protein [Rhizobium sp. T1473]